MSGRSRWPEGWVEQAGAQKAFVRSRQLRSAGDLLRGLLAYVLFAHSFRQLGAWSLMLGMADVSENAWLSWLFCERLAVAQAVSPWLVQGGWRRILLIDATHLKAPGRESRIWRLHTAFDLLAGRLTDLVVTDRHEAEDLRLLSIASGDLVIADSGYGFRDRIAHVLSVQIALQAHEATLGQTPDPLSQSGERTRQHCHFPVVLVVAGGRSGAGATGSQ